MAGAENLADVARRSLDGLEELTRRHCGETFLIVSHRGLIKPMIAAAIGIAQPNFWKLLVDNASISILMHTERFGFCLTSLNDKAHLEGIPGVQEFE